MILRTVQKCQICNRKFPKTAKVWNLDRGEVYDVIGTEKKGKKCKCGMLIHQALWTVTRPNGEKWLCIGTPNGIATISGALTSKRLDFLNKQVYLPFEVKIYKKRRGKLIET